MSTHAKPLGPITQAMRDEARRFIREHGLRPYMETPIAALFVPVSDRGALLLALMTLREAALALEPYIDADCTGDPSEYVPNEAMRVLTRVEEAIAKIEREVRR